jgi:hypothetical protein
MKLKKELSSEIIHILQSKTNVVVLEIINDLQHVTEFVTQCDPYLDVGKHHLQQLL